MECGVSLRDLLYEWAWVACFSVGAAEKSSFQTVMVYFLVLDKVIHVLDIQYKPLT
jgi:hypothetical protein